jgi:hypothetical protein
MLGFDTEEYRYDIMSFTLKKLLHAEVSLTGAIKISDLLGNSGVRIAQSV